MAAMDNPSDHLYGIVDMGSNGIRFSITDLSGPSARSLPTVFQSRSGISLYDAQYSTGIRGPIPQAVIDAVLAALLRFKTTCADFDVPEANVKVLATEATRTAVNSVEYRRQIRESTGWEVELLAKESEGRIGAMGVASSFQEVEGLVMDLGGGSTQMTWMVSKDGVVQTSPSGSFSFPYGAAALTRRLSEAERQGSEAKETLAAEMKSNFQTAYHDLAIPPSLHAAASRDGGFTLYLSGGGFRGWGYLLMSQSRISPYPIPIINGLQVPIDDFQRITQIQQIAASQQIFGVSSRRAAQVPAVAFLVNVLCLSIPSIRQIRFCQGGVREGYLFGNYLDQATRAIDPLTAASARYATPSAAAIATLLNAALPQSSPSPPASLTPALISALASLMYFHSPLAKESASLSALYTPISGILASAHGVSHPSRALLALMLCERWSGELAPPHDILQERLRQLLTREEVWWCNYVGKVAGLVGDVYPAGVVKRERVGFSAGWVSGGLGKKGAEGGLRLTIKTNGGDLMTEGGVLGKAVEGVEAVGKKKHRIGGGGKEEEGGFGIRVEVQLVRD